MSKDRKSNKEVKKQPQKSLMEKRAAKKSRSEDKGFATTDGVLRRQPPAPGAKRS